MINIIALAHYFFTPGTARCLTRIVFVHDIGNWALVLPPWQAYVL